LLQVIGEEEGPAGGRLLTKTTFIQRLNTNGGLLLQPAALLPAMWENRPSCRTRPITFFFRADR